MGNGLRNCCLHVIFIKRIIYVYNIQAQADLFMEGVLLLAMDTKIKQIYIVTELLEDKYRKKHAENEEFETKPKLK